MSILVGTLAAVTIPPVAAVRAVTPCGPGSNPITCENSKTGTPSENWYAPNAYGEIQGFGTRESVQPGETIEFKVKSPISFEVDVFRLGWYNGNGARKMPTSPTTLHPAQTQPNCLTDSTGLVDCGNWSVTASWTVPNDAVSGVYLAVFDQSDNNGAMPFPFVVRDESSHSDIVVQTSDQTWHAYNTYGGRNLYDGTGPAPDGRAYKVSYNRPLDIGGDNGLYGSEYAMIAWLERNGYDVSYLSGLDVSTRGSLLLNHKLYVSSGHDEYWNQAQWDNVVAAREAGVNLAFFAGNDVFWRTRLEPSIDGANTANRTLVCYKMTKMALNNGIPDPSGQWTGTWMDPVGAGSGGGQPQNQLTGTLFRANGYRNDSLTVSADHGKMRMWRNTSVATLPPGGEATFQPGTLGYEWNVDEDNGFRPAGMINLSSTTVNITDGTYLLDNGNTYGNGVATHSMTMYRDPSSNALVFSSGTVQWSWGLHTVHVGNATTEDVRMQQATANLLADLGVQPQTLQSNLVAATASTDSTGPTITVANPTNGADLPALSPVTVSGTAAELGGGRLARVEVSANGGATWKRADGLGSWTYSWTPTQQGPATIQVRAIDDSVNVGPVVSLTVNVVDPQCPCSVFPLSVTPTQVDSGDYSMVQLGTKFRTTRAGSITGIRFYQSALNTGNHIGYLWSSGGQLLGVTAMNGTTGAGWRTLNFATPIPVKPNTTYIASYLAPNGHYSADPQYFNGKGAGLEPITALSSGVDGPNGVYRYGNSLVMPTASYSNTNYYVDAILDTSLASTTSPTVTSTTPAALATNVGITSQVKATFSAGMDQPTIQFTLTSSGGQQVSGSIGYDPATYTATFAPGGQLALGETYTASARGTDLWGNVMPEPHTWSFTTSSTPPAITCPCSLWPDNPTPQVVHPGDPSPVEVGMRFTSSVDGWITGVRYYQGPANTGTHYARLWTANGTLLANGELVEDNTQGWKTLTFALPVAITANTVYVVSYYAPVGQYAVNTSYFTANRFNYPLTGLASTPEQANGLFRYGVQSNTTPVMPNNSFNASNYWVDPVFSNTAPGGGAAAVPSGLGTTESVAFAWDTPAASRQLPVADRLPLDRVSRPAHRRGAASIGRHCRTLPPVTDLIRAVVRQNEPRREGRHGCASRAVTRRPGR